MRRFPDLKLRLHKKIHSKVVLIEPDIVIVGSHNFGDTAWHETSVVIRSPEVHDWYVANEWQELWEESNRVKVEEPPEEGFIKS